MTNRWIYHHSYYRLFIIPQTYNGEAVGEYKIIIRNEIEVPDNAEMSSMTVLAVQYEFTITIAPCET